MSLPLPNPHIADRAVRENFERIALALPNANSLTSEGWHEVGTSGEPAFQNLWVNFGAPYNTAAFYKDGFGRVHLRGVITSGTSGAAAFTLPTGYRPSATLLFPPASKDSAQQKVEIAADGAVKPSGSPDSLDGISFRAA